MAQEVLHHGHPVIRRIYFYIFILTFLLLFGFVVLYFVLVQPLSQPEETSEGLTPTAVVLPTENKGSLTLTVQNNQLAEAQVGQTFNLTVSASSEGSEIVGYDILLSYDKDAFTVGKATTPLQSFQVYPNSHDQYMTFTGALNISGTPLVFSQTPILTVPFTPKLKGKYTFEILPKAQNELTKLVESQTTHLFAPQVSSLQVTVN